MNISIIIPTINPSLQLHQQIQKIINSSLKKFEIIIIHQGTKGSLKINNKKINYFKIPKKALSLAKNIGIKKSNSPIITFIDDDIILNINYFKHGLKIFNSKKNYEILFGNIINKQNKKKFSFNIPSNNTNINFSNFLGGVASTMWIRKSFKSQNNFFDEKFGIGSKFGSGEETDVVIRTLIKRKKLFFFKQYPLIHNEENIYQHKKIIKKFFSYGMGNGALYKKYVLKKNYKFFILYLINIIKSLLSVIISLFYIKNVKVFLKYISLTTGRILGFLVFKNND